MNRKANLQYAADRPGAIDGIVAEDGEVGMIGKIGMIGKAGVTGVLAAMKEWDREVPYCRIRDLHRMKLDNRATVGLIDCEVVADGGRRTGEDTNLRRIYSVRAQPFCESVAH